MTALLGNVGEVGVPAVPEAWQPVGHGTPTRSSVGVIAISVSDGCTAAWAGQGGAADGIVLPANGWTIGGATGAGAAGAGAGASAGAGAAEATGGAADDAAAGGGSAMGSGCCCGGGGACCFMPANGWVGATVGGGDSGGCGCGCGWVGSTMGGVCPRGNDGNGCSGSLTRQRLVGEGRISVKWDL